MGETLKERVRHIKRALTCEGCATYAEALQAERCVEVRPLVWDDLGARVFPDGSGQIHCAAVGLHGFQYTIYETKEAGIYVTYSYGGFYHDAESVEDAKAAAQADYERRILSAITTRPASEVRAEAHAAAVEAAASIYEGAFDSLAGLIRALHTDASRAAIERIKREARNEVLNGVAKALSHAGNEGAASIVTALIEKEGV